MQSIPGLLQEELRQLEAFIAHLRHEQEAIKCRDAQKLNKAILDKSALLESLNQLEANRNALLKARGFGADRDGVDAWLDRHDSQGEARRQWSELLSRAKQAKELNDLNGRLIAIHLQATQEVLAAISPPKVPTTLYGANGQVSAPTGNRIIDAA